MSKTYLVCLLIALFVMDEYANDGRGARLLLLAGQSAGEKINGAVDSAVRGAFPQGRKP